MAEITTIARPYARAVFEQAQSKKGGLKRWSAMLQALALIAADKSMRSVLTDPRVDAERKADILLGVCGELPDINITKEGQNFIRLLAENHRLAVLPEIAELFEKLRAEAEKTIHARLISAFDVTNEQREKIAAALKTRLKHEVVLDCTVDESLIGGAVIRAGDLVIDGSAQGKLARLANALRQ